MADEGVDLSKWSAEDVMTVLLAAALNGEPGVDFSGHAQVEVNEEGVADHLLVTDPKEGYQCRVFVFPVEDDLLEDHHDLDGFPEDLSIN